MIIDLVDNIERLKELEIEVYTDEHEKKEAKGKVRISYSGQPVFCRTCNENHTERCPELTRKEIEEKEDEKKRVDESTTLMIGDSNVRRVNEKAFLMQTDCATGAKIGHIANSLAYYEANEKTSKVIIHCGQNNVVHEDVDLESWESQMKTEVASLKKDLKRLKNVSCAKTPRVTVGSIKHNLLYLFYYLFTIS